ncbi:MAG: transposase [Flavobacteriales bacterium Tduv]
MSCIRFCGFRLEDQIPDHTTLCRFLNEIVTKKAYDRLLKKINKELENHQAIVKIGVIVDSSITVSLLFPKGAPYLRSQRSEGRRAKANYSKKSKAKKRDSIRIIHSRKMA